MAVLLSSQGSIMKSFCIQSISYLVLAHRSVFRPFSLLHRIQKWDNRKLAFRWIHNWLQGRYFSRYHFRSWRHHRHTLKSPFRQQPWLWEGLKWEKVPHRVVFLRDCWSRLRHNIWWPFGRLRHGGYLSGWFWVWWLF